MTTATYTVPEMSCSHCEEAVEGALAAVAGVEAVEVDLGTKLVGHPFRTRPLRHGVR